MTAAGTGIDGRYRVLSMMLSPLLIVWSAWQSVQARDARLLRQRLGFDLPMRNDRPLWLHMSSVGEVNAAEPLIAALRRRYPELPILVTTFTTTGAETAQRKFGAAVEHVYLPLDLGPSVRAFLRRSRPRCALIMETEVWPRLFHQCRADGVPLLIVNGRLSQRTLGKPAWMRRILTRAIGNVDRILARSERDAAGFRTLGATAEQLAVVDNLKFARPSGAGAAPIPIMLPRPYVLLASTHDDEELRIARAWLASGLRDSCLLVIVPRHPKRKTALLAQLRPLVARLAVRSDSDPVDGDTQIYLADTFGELQGFIAGAEAVFVGGSLIPRGGQNVIEVARAGKVALFGPHMDNFADERDLLLDHHAAVTVDDAAELVSVMTSLLENPERLRDIGERARALVEAKGAVVERYIDSLNPYIMR